MIFYYKDDIFLLNWSTGWLRSVVSLTSCCPTCSSRTSDRSFCFRKWNSRHNTFEVTFFYQICFYTVTPFYELRHTLMNCDTLKWTVSHFHELRHLFMSCDTFSYTVTIFSGVTFIYTVKPMFNDHPWEPKIVKVVERWSLRWKWSLEMSLLAGGR